MKKYEKVFPFKDYLIADVLKWVEANVPQYISSSVSSDPKKHLWRVEWYDND